MALKSVMGSFKLTVQERILLHLGEHSKYVDQLEVPFALTQEGIAQSVGVVRSAIPRAIKKLISKNHVREELAHVNGLSRRRKIYYLTTDGLVYSSELKNKLYLTNIKIITTGNQRVECKISEVSKKLNQKIPILDIITNLNSENVFDFTEFKAAQNLKASNHTQLSGLEKQRRKIKESRHFIDKAPKISYFVGRKAELDTIYSYFEKEPCKIIIVHGIAGIGKTTLAVKLLDNLYSKKNLFWYRFHEWDTIRNILTSISKFFEYFNKIELKDYLEHNQNIDLNEVAEILENEFDGLNAIFFLDDFHKINDQLLSLYTLLREMLERVTGVRFLIFTRSIIPFYDRRDVVVKKLIAELELGGLNEEESKELLKYRQIKIDNFNQIYKLTKGHPLSLELLDPEMDLEAQKNIKIYLEEEVLTRLAIREKSLLKIASVFRYPVPAEGFFIFEKAQISRETLSVLTRKTLIKESKEGYEVHDMIRDFFYNYLTRQEQISYHRKIGKFYLTQLKMINNILKKKISTDFLPRNLIKSFTDTKDIKNQSKLNGTKAGNVEPLLENRARGIIEAQYHFLMAEDFNRAAEVAIIMGHELLNLSYAEEFLDNLEKIELEKLSNEYWMDLKILKGDVQKALGDLPRAQELYKQSLYTAETENNQTKLAELYRKLGSIHEKLNDYETAIELLTKSLKISKMLGDAKNISDTYGNLGDVYWKMSEFNKSNKFYNKCVESAEEISDLSGRAKTYLSLGIISAKRGQFEESIKYYERCLDILDKEKGMESFNYSNFYENLGDHYLKTIFSFYIQSSDKDN